MQGEQKPAEKKEVNIHQSQYDKVYDYFSKPLAGFFVRMMPVRLHPNTYTWVGFCACLISIYSLLTHDPDASGRIYWVVLAIALFCYNIMDAMDGIVARQEKIPSCEGEVLDHMIDAVCTVTPLTLGWVGRSPLGVTRKMILGHMVYYLCHVHHRFSDGPLVQGIYGFGVDAAELTSALAAFVWFLNLGPAVSDPLFYYFVTLSDYLCWIGVFYFAFLCYSIGKEKNCLNKMVDLDVVCFFVFFVTALLWAPAFSKATFGFWFVSLMFTMPLYFFRTLYQRLAKKNETFKFKHAKQFQIVGYIIRILLFLHLASLLPIPAIDARREGIFFAEALVAVSGAFATLLHTHMNGPLLPKEAPWKQNGAAGADSKQHQASSSEGAAKPHQN